MSASISPDRITGAVLLVNDVFRTHVAQDARKLHGSRWEQYVSKEGAHLDPESFLSDAEKSELLIETIDRVLNATPLPRSTQAVRLRFGIDNGQLRTLKRIGEEIDPGKTLKPERPRQLVSEGVAMVRGFGRNHLGVFYGEKTATQIRAELQALPEPGQRRR